MKLDRIAAIASGALVLAASFQVHAQRATQDHGAASTVAEAPNPASGATSQADDRALRRRVLTALGKAKGLRATGIAVRATDGDVLLEGWVPEQAQIDQAERVAQAVPGVRAVRNALTLSTF
jgi:osmotically-inducible protein OsmY